jgi:hypothetical protein
MRFKEIGEEMSFFNKINMTPEEKLQRDKALSRNIAEARQRAKRDTCMYCGKRVTSFCNSHSVPRFVLDNIDNSGEVLSHNAILHLPPSALKEAPGLKKAGTFHIICEDCDHVIFRDYEKPDSYSNQASITSEILSQIALKNYLFVIAKRRFEVELRKITQEKVGFDIYQEEIDVFEMDILNYTNKYRKAKNAVNKKSDSYFMFYFKLLDYVVPIAYQGIVALSMGLNGQMINDVYNYNPKYCVSDLHICVFPLENQTAIMLFIEDGDKRYRKFYKEFNTLSLEEQLGIINYILFLYTEDYFLSKSLYDELQNESVRKCSSLSLTAYKDNPSEDITPLLKENFNLSNWRSINNFLSKKYKLR